MTCLVHASCGDCGDITVTTADVTVRLCATDGSRAYVLRCPACRGIVARRVAPSLGELLVARGAALQVWSMPAELAEPHDGPPISADDLIDFHRALKADTWGAA